MSKYGMFIYEYKKFYLHSKNYFYKLHELVVTVEDNKMLVGWFLVIMFFGFFFGIIGPFFVFANFEKNKEKIKTELYDYLKTQQVDVNSNDKYASLLEFAQQRFIKSVHNLSSFYKMSVFIFALVCWNIYLAGIMFSVAIVIIPLKVAEARKASHFDEKLLDEYTCPKCKQKLCWFVSRTYDDKEQYYTTHERREETDSKGKIHIVYAPVDHVKFKRYTIYHCDKCHHEEEVTQDIDNRIN